MAGDGSFSAMDHVAGIVQAFIREDAQHRALELLARRHPSGSRQWQERSQLVAHCRVLRQSEMLRPVHPSADALLAALSRGGRSECCGVGAVDNEIADLDEATTRIISKGSGAFVSVVPGALACYVGDLGEQSLLLMQRPPDTLLVKSWTSHSSLEGAIAESRAAKSIHAAEV